MKCVCVKEVLENAISLAERFTGKNINLPIVSTLLLEAQENTLCITATNLEYAFQISVPAQVSSRGVISVPARILQQFIQSIKEKEVHLEEKNKNLIIKTAVRDGKINGLDPDDFPIIPKIKKTEQYYIQSADFSAALERVIPAISFSEFKPELNGVFLRLSKNEYIVAATDTFRLAEKKVKTEPQQEETTKNCTLPTKISQELSKIFSSEDVKLTLSFGENQVEIKNENIKVLSRLIDGAFPEYNAIIPKTFSTSLFIPKEELINAVRSSSIFSSKLQDVHLSFSQKKLEVTSQNSELGASTAAIPTTINGKPLTMQFNHRFLLDGVSGVDEDELFFGANDPNTPALIKNKNDASFTYVVMPIRQT
ncbi:MAG: DNA polymerase III subunit beta [Candidatus Sungbacteria bacterium RIFCSPHIGHO2_01_FULL_50_25]|uniref:Beta sliding clamp n=1 Tax=Candidatus Sungbacteria bacterium RIFCSPHIGHO2_01_FULL_50_25 TaxID=1802265 RepID=A0A1G2KBJ3_9BACT|nr:MAG: DNA polymerase III subunit beta [Candidatus Sungbacteria bacterium RIFCSPHIGHO2_01_FULL_50_25]